jgi:hypothetical protein
LLSLRTIGHGKGSQKCSWMNFTGVHGKARDGDPVVDG